MQDEAQCLAAVFCRQKRASAAYVNHHPVGKEMHLRTSGKGWLSQKLKARKREQFCGTTRIPSYIPLKNRNSRFSRLVLRENLTLRIASTILRSSLFVNWLPSCKKAPCHSYFFAVGEKMSLQSKISYFERPNVLCG